MATAQQPLEVVLVPPTINHEPGRYSLVEMRFPQELVNEDREKWYNFREETVVTHVESIIYSVSPTNKTKIPDTLYIYLAGVATPIIRLVSEVNPNAKIQPGDRLKVTRSFKQGDNSIHIRCEEIAIIRETDGRKSYQHFYPRGDRAKRIAAHRKRLH